MNDAIEIDDVSKPTDCTYPVRILQTGETYACHGTESLLQGMARIGKKGIAAGCLNGGCGVCKVAIRSGSVRKIGAMSRAHISEQDEAQEMVLACRVAPMSPVEVDVVGKLKKAVTCAAWSAICSAK
jgi:ferredoxin